jgi:hypothetical protein
LTIRPQLGDKYVSTLKTDGPQAQAGTRQAACQREKTS